MKYPLLLLSLCLLTIPSFCQDVDAAAGLSFRPDRVSAERMKQLLLAKVAQQNPRAAALLSKELAGKDVSALFEQAAAPFGLHDGNLADAITARDFMKQARESGSAAPSLSEILQQRQNTAHTLSNQSGPHLEAKRRELAEIAEISFVVDYLTWSNVRSTQSSAPTTAAPGDFSSGSSAPVPSAAEQSGTFVAPIGAATQSAGNFTPMGSTIHVEAWYLYPNGIATDCSAHDPATLQISLPALRAMRDCTGARWRRTGGKVQIQVSDREPWNDALEQPAQRPGTRIQYVGVTAGGRGTMPGGAGVSINTVDDGRLLLTDDGHIRTVLSSATAVGGAGIGGGSSSSRRLDGTYTIDGYVMTIAVPGGQTFRRLVTVVHEAGKVYVYFQRREYWPPGR